MVRPAKRLSGALAWKRRIRRSAPSFTSCSAVSTDAMPGASARASIAPISGERKASSMASSGASSSWEISKRTSGPDRSSGRVQHPAGARDGLDLGAPALELGDVLHREEARGRALARDAEQPRREPHRDLVEEPLELDGAGGA